jgi:hypothetical protein
MLMVKVEFFKTSMLSELDFKFVHTSVKNVNSSEFKQFLKEF